MWKLVLSVFGLARIEEKPVATGGDESRFPTIGAVADRAFAKVARCI